MARLLHRLWADRRGTVTIELAVIIPLLCLIMLGMFETYQYLRAVSVTERIAFTLADLVARRTVLNDCVLTDSADNLGTYFEAAASIAKPLDLPGSGMVIVSAVDRPGTVPMVAWQKRTAHTLDGETSALGAAGQPARLPAGLPVATGGDTVIVAEAFYDFTPFAGTRAFWPEAPGRLTIRRIAYYRARFGMLNVLTTVPNCSQLP